MNASARVGDQAFLLDYREPTVVSFSACPQPTVSDTRLCSTLDAPNTN